MSIVEPTYRWSRTEAEANGETELWLESYRINCDCARFIEKQISANYADNRLNEQGVKAAIEKYGFDRVNRVLANTVTENKTDGRFSADNKKWAAGFNIPREENRYNYNYSVNSHPGLVDVFVNQARKEWENLKLYDFKSCYEDRTDYTGKVLAVRPDILKDEYKTPADQLFYATGGFGCKSDSLGRKIYGVLLKDGEECVFLRGEVTGAVKLELSRAKPKTYLPQSRRFRPFRQMLARCIDIHLRSPLPKIIKNGGFEVASEFYGKKTIKTRQSSEGVHSHYERE